MKYNIKKVIILSLVIILDIILILYLFGAFKYSKEGNEVKYEASMKEKYLNDIREDYIKLFIKTIIEEDYKTAYGMLTAECKSEQFKSNIENFTNEIKTYFFNKEKPTKECYYTLSGENEYLVTVIIKEIDDYYKMTDDDMKYYSFNKIKVKIEETSLFNYKLNIEFET